MELSVIENEEVSSVKVNDGSSDEDDKVDSVVNGSEESMDVREGNKDE